MGFKNKPAKGGAKSKGSDRKDSDKDYRNVGTIWDSQHFDGQYVQVPQSEDKDGEPNEYHKGDLIWRDNETGKFYKIKQMSVFEPRGDKAPKAKVADLVIDLNSEYNVESLEE